MKRSTERILTTHAGSLPKPAELAELHRARARGGQVDEPTRERQVRDAVDEVVALQCENGVDVISDGEQSKTDFTTYAAMRIKGLEHRPGSGPAPTVADRQRRDYPGYFADRPPSRPQMFCTGALEYVGHDEVRTDIENLRRALDGRDIEDAYLPAVAPATIEHWVVNEHYPDDESYLEALGDVMRKEYEAIVDAGLVLQIDNPDLPDGWGIYTDMDLDQYRKFQWLRVETLNHALRNIPPDRVRLHVCWGAHHGPHDTDIPMRDIIDLVLAVNVGGYSFPAASTRHEHEWKVWSDVDVPADTVLVPGVVGHDSDTVEHPEVVADRIIRFAEIVGRENVLAGTDCGFGTAGVHPEITWAKFRALRDGARLASAELWSDA